MNWLFAARALRDFGDGFESVLLPVYQTLLGLTPVQVGVVATAALAGSAFITIGIGLFGGRHDLRALLLGASALMVATGVAFALVNDYAVLLVVACVGTANPSAGNVSLFVPLEHASLAREAGDAERTRMFARYAFLGSIAAACGGLAAASPDFIATLGLARLTAIKLMFVLYGFLGVLGALAYVRLPKRPPAGEEVPPTPLGPSRGIVIKLAALFSLDAFAGGFMVQSLLALWLFENFQLSLSAASLFFFWSNLIAAGSLPIAGWLGRRIGLVNTMVFTHIPSSVFVILAAFAPTLPLAIACLSARALLMQMDVPARSSYVMAVVTPAERTAAASFTSVPRSFASAISPTFAGLLLASSFRGWPLVICGTLKIVYDLLLLVQFRHVKPPEER